MLFEPPERLRESRIEWCPEKLLNDAGFVAHSLIKTVLAQRQVKLFNRMTDLAVFSGKDYERHGRN